MFKEFTIKISTQDSKEPTVSFPQENPENILENFF